jgi:hypothetical protein
MIELNFSGIVVGVCSFLIIGLFHPLVIKAEYYFGVRFWWVFLIMGLLGLAGSLFVTHQILSVLLGGVSGRRAIISFMEALRPLTSALTTSPASRGISFAFSPRSSISVS